MMMRPAYYSASRLLSRSVRVPIFLSYSHPPLFVCISLSTSCSIYIPNQKKEYIGIWDMSVLTDRPEVWSVAVSQIFFSLSVTFGTMTAYGSHCPRGEPAFLNSTVIGCSNSMFSFLSGFAVFAALGHLSYITGIPVDDIPYAGFKLVFGTWPVVFGALQGGEHWVSVLARARGIEVIITVYGVHTAFS